MKTFAVRDGETLEPLGMFPAISEEAASIVLRLNFPKGSFVQDISHLSVEAKARLLIEVLQNA